MTGKRQPLQARGAKERFPNTQVAEPAAGYPRLGDVQLAVAHYAKQTNARGCGWLGKRALMDVRQSAGCPGPVSFLNAVSQRASRSLRPLRLLCSSPHVRKECRSLSKRSLVRKAMLGHVKECPQRACAACIHE